MTATEQLRFCAFVGHWKCGTGKRGTMKFTGVEKQAQTS